MKTLADLKRNLQKTLEASGLILTTVYDANGNIIRQNEPTTLHRVITTGFSLNRQQGPSWVNFNKAKDWEFRDMTATQQLKQGKMTFEFLPAQLA